MIDPWTIEESPFHEGEQSAQERVGLREEMETWAHKVVRDHMPDQHRQFYTMLPFLMIGSVDNPCRPWALLVPVRPGFISAPNPNTLDIAPHPKAGQMAAPTSTALTSKIPLPTRSRPQMGTAGFAIPQVFCQKHSFN